MDRQPDLLTLANLHLSSIFRNSLGRKEAREKHLDSFSRNLSHPHSTHNSTISSFNRSYSDIFDSPHFPLVFIGFRLRASFVPSSKYLVSHFLKYPAHAHATTIIFISFSEQVFVLTSSHSFQNDFYKAFVRSNLRYDATNCCQNRDKQHPWFRYDIRIRGSFSQKEEQPPDDCHYHCSVCM